METKLFETLDIFIEIFRKYFNMFIRLHFMTFIASIIFLSCCYFSFHLGISIFHRSFQSSNLSKEWSKESYNLPPEESHKMSPGISNKLPQGVSYILPTGTQMGSKQVQEICSVLPRDGNLLVWGLGHDSSFWNNLTTGKRVFIEDNSKWIQKYQQLEVFQVKYASKDVLSTIWKQPDEWKSKLDISSQLPGWIHLTYWNVIIVDAPSGKIGRYQSIYTSFLLARNMTHVFVDDFERALENEVSRKLFGEPFNVVKREGGRHLNANMQAHFIFF